MRPLTLVPVGAVVLFGMVGCVGGAGGVDVGESSYGLSVCAKGPVTKGVDVSHYDGTIDWSAAHGGGVAFAFMKATENTNFVDPQFAANWKGAGANGVIRSAYHFFRPAVDATAQADYFLQTAGIPGAGDLPPTIDLEVTDSVAAATVASGALTFLARVEQKTGRKPIVYTSASFLSSIGSPAGFSAYTLWVANWQVSCPKIPSPPWSDWTFWQDSSTATFPGIPATMVDSDQFNGTLADLQNFVNGPSGGPDGGGVTLDGGTAGDAGDAADGGDSTVPGDDLGKSDSPPGGDPGKLAPHGGCSAAGSDAARSDRSTPALALLLVLALLLARTLRRR